MKHLFCAFFIFYFVTSSFSQSKVKADKYPSLLWEISGKGLPGPSYLFGTMHVSSKMAFNLSDSFYIGIKNAQIVALETNPGTWQEDFSRYEMDSENPPATGRYGYQMKGYASPQDYLSINTLKFTSYEKVMEAALYSSPTMINNFLYRSNTESSSDFEEDTYLDLHIFQAGKKLGKKICGVEDFDGSMQLVKEAYADAAKEKRRERNYDFEDDFSYRHLEEAYRTGNLDLLDTINKVNSQSAAFDEKFLYKRNEIQANSIDSIIKKRNILFVGVGAAHLPGDRGVIALLRRMGYNLRPIRMKDRDQRHKEAIEKLRVPVQFSRQTSEDGFFSVNIPGKLYSFEGSYAGAQFQQYADMVNGSYYTVCRIVTNAAILGHSEAMVERKIDSVLYENIPGKLLAKKAILKNGYRGFDVTNRTRRGDYQRYNIFVTPFEVIIFKMSGNGDYVKLGTEANQFFNSIQLKELKNGWRNFKPVHGGFEVELPHEPQLFRGQNWYYAAYDAETKTGFDIIRTDIYNHNFLEQDSFDLNLMEESFGSSDYIQRSLSRKQALVGDYSALDVQYKYKDSSVAHVRYLINGPRYYTLVAKAEKENKQMQRFINSFKIKPFNYGEMKKEADSVLNFTVITPVSLEKKRKLGMYPESAFGSFDPDNDDDSLIDNGQYLDKIISFDSTGEKVYVSYYKVSRYYYKMPPEKKTDSSEIGKQWVVRRMKKDTLANDAIVTEYELGNKESSRMIKAKTFERNGVGYKLETQLDTVSTPSRFITSFFETFTPSNKMITVSTGEKKTGLFFSQFFSQDSILHKTAVKNIQNIVMDSTDFMSLKKSIASLSWKEKKYLDVKKSFIGKLSSMPTIEAAEYLKSIYSAVGDTVELQYTILETLLQQATAYAYKTFASIVENDPPVLDIETTNKSGYAKRSYAIDYDSPVYNSFSGYSNGSFMDDLSDSLNLAAGIYKNLLPLINIDDYEQSIMSLTATLLDSGLIKATDYELYLGKLVIEAKQLLKKQVIQEKTIAIEKAQENMEAQSRYNQFSRNEEYGNGKLSLYATLLLPFWDNHPQVKPILNQMLTSNDKRLKYNTLVLLLRNKRPIPDTLLSYFAGMDEFRYELYTDLQRLKQLALFPSTYQNQTALARSQVISSQSYSRPDTIAFMQRVPLEYNGRAGYIYVFKYKSNKTDHNWKLVTVGLLPKDETKFNFNDDSDLDNERKYNFTDLTATKLTAGTSEKEQVEKMIKKLLYSKRKSAAEFYNDNSRYNNIELTRIRD